MRKLRLAIALTSIATTLLGAPGAAHAGGATSGFNLGNLQKTDAPQPCALIESSSNQRLTAGSRSPVTINASVFNCSSHT
jgi:hypothetical protein